MELQKDKVRDSSGKSEGGEKAVQHHLMSQEIQLLQFSTIFLISAMSGEC